MKFDIIITDNHEITEVGMKDTYSELKAALEALKRANETIYEKPDFEGEYDHYKDVQYLIEEAMDAVRGAIALT